MNISSLLCQNTAEISNEQKFTNQNFGIVCLLVWDYLEDNFSCEKEMSLFFILEIHLSK